MALSVTKICNLSLSDLGSLRINDFGDTTESSTQAILCRLHYEPVRDALEQAHRWRFNSDRKTLSRDTTDPDFEWGAQFILPTDYLSMRSIYEGRFSDDNIRSYALEGKRLLTNETTMEIRYIKKVTDVTEFDPLFVQLLVLHLDLKLVMPLTQDVKLKQTIKEDIRLLMPDILAKTGQETNTAGRFESSTWNDARFSGRDPMRL